MAFGTFTLTGQFETLNGVPATGRVQIEGNPRVIRDTAGNKASVGPRTVLLDTDGNFSTTLPSDSTTGNSTGISYTVTTRLTGLTNITPVTFYARPIGSTVALTPLLNETIIPLAPNGVSQTDFDAYVASNPGASNTTVAGYVTGTGSTKTALDAAYARRFVDVDSQTGASDTVKMQAAINAAAANIAAGSGPVEVRMAARLHTWTTSVPKLPRGLASRLVINGNGATVRLSTTATAFLEFNKVADYDTFQNISIRDVDIDNNNVAGFGHVIIGTGTYSASNLVTTQRINVDRFDVRRVRAYNIPTNDTATGLRAGVYLMGYLSGAAGESTVGMTNIVCEDVRVEGGNFGIAVGARFTSSSRVWVDSVNISRCYHDTGYTGTAYRGCTNFFVGARAQGGFGVIRDCIGKNSGDDGVETNAMQNMLVDNVEIHNAHTAAFLHANQGVPVDPKTQRLVWRNCKAYISLATGATSVNGNGYRLNTVTVASTTTAVVASGDTTIPLTSVTPGGSEVYFPLGGGKVYANGQTITYTGVTGTTLTGVTGVGAAGIPSGGTVTLVNDMGHLRMDGCTMHKINQPYWEGGGDFLKATGPVRRITMTDCDYTLENTQANIGSAATPSVVWVNALPSEGAETVVKVDGMRMYLTGARTGGATADWRGIWMNGSKWAFYGRAIHIENLMTGMSIATRIAGLHFGGATSGDASSSVVDIAGLRVARLGDVGANTSAVRFGTQTQLNSRYNRIDGYDGHDLIAGSTDIAHDSGGAIPAVTWVTHVLNHGNLRRAHVNLLTNASSVAGQTNVTTGTWSFWNTASAPGKVIVRGGTVSQIQTASSGSGAYVDTGLTAGIFHLDVGDYLQLTSTVVPTAATFIPTQ